MHGSTAEGVGGASSAAGTPSELSELVRRVQRTAIDDGRSPGVAASGGTVPSPAPGQGPCPTGTPAVLRPPSPAPAGAQQQEGVPDASGGGLPREAPQATAPSLLAPAAADEDMPDAQAAEDPARAARGGGSSGPVWRPGWVGAVGESVHSRLIVGVPRYQWQTDPAMQQAIWLIIGLAYIGCCMAGSVCH